MSEQDEAQRREVIRENATDNHNREWPRLPHLDAAGALDRGPRRPCPGHLVTAPAGSEDAGLRAVYDHQARIWRGFDGHPLDTDARVRDALNGLRSLAAEISDYGGEDAELASATYRHAADLVEVALDQKPHIAQGSQEARNGPVSDEGAGDGRGHGRHDESGRGADW